MAVQVLTGARLGGRSPQWCCADMPLSLPNTDELQPVRILKRKGMKTAATVVIIAAVLPIIGAHSAEKHRELGNTLFEILWAKGPKLVNICSKLIRIDRGAKVSLKGDETIETITIIPHFASALLEPVFFGDATNKIRKTAYTSGVLELRSRYTQLPLPISTEGASPSDEQRALTVPFDQVFLHPPIIFMFTLATVDQSTNIKRVAITRIENGSFNISLEEGDLAPERIRWVAIEAPRTYRSIETWRNALSCLKRMISESETISNQLKPFFRFLSNLPEETRR